MVPTTWDAEAEGLQLQGLPEPYILIDCQELSDQSNASKTTTQDSPHL